MRFYDGENPPNRYDSKELWPRLEDVEGAQRCLKMGLNPSVTAVLDTTRSEHLERWFIGQGIEEFQTNGGDKKAAVNHIYDRESANAQFGTDCHEVMEAAMLNKPMPDVSEEVIKHSAPLVKWIRDNVKETLFCERTMSSNALGTAGTVDMVFIHNNGRRIIGDLKVVKFSWMFPPKPDVKYKMQLSAYEGLIQEIRPDNYTRMSIYLASPFGGLNTPDIKIFEHGMDYIPAFKAARVIWEATLMQEMPTAMRGAEVPATWDPKTYKKTK